MEKLTLEEKVTAAGKGDPMYYEEVCRSFIPLAKRMASQPHIRPIYDEAYSLAMLKIAEAVREYQPESGVSFTSFVYSKVKYAIWNLFKKERRIWQKNLSPAGELADKWLAQIPSELSLEDELIAAQQVQLLRRAVSELPPLQRSIIEAVFFAGCKPGEVAAQLHLSPQSVSGYKTRALRRLRQQQEFMDMR